MANQCSLVLIGVNLCWLGVEFGLISVHLCTHTARAVSLFWPKSQRKNGNRVFYPSAKSRTELKLSSLGVVFRGRRASGAQKFIAPPKRLVLDLTVDSFQNVFVNFVFRRRKTKCWESSETRFPKVSWRSEPSLRGKRPFEVSKNFRNCCCGGP